MFAYTRIQKAYNSATTVDINSKSKLVMMSDCHRGTGSAADDFAKNQNIYHAALNHYFRDGFTYIELGDGDELWENRHFPMIMQAHRDTFQLLSKFHKSDRLYMIYGNHDMDKKDPEWVARYFEGSLVSGYTDTPVENHSNRADFKRSDNSSGKNLGTPAFPGIKMHEGIILMHQPSGKEILLIHGHQADFFNFRMWRLARFMVRYLWRPLELIGVQNPFDTPHRPGRRNIVERFLIDWCKRAGKMLIAGHTHNTSFPVSGEPPYYNDGSIVSRQHITCLEIEDDCISLVKWSLQPRRDGVLYVRRDVLAHREINTYAKAVT